MPVIVVRGLPRNKGPPTINSTLSSCLTAMEVRRARARCRHGWFLLRALGRSVLSWFLVVARRPLVVLGFRCIVQSLLSSYRVCVSVFEFSLSVRTLVIMGWDPP